MTSYERIINTEAFKNLGEDRRQLLKEFLDKKSIGTGDAVAFFTKMKSMGELSPEHQKELMSAFVEGLDEKERKRLDNILDILKAFALNG